MPHDPMTAEEFFAPDRVKWQGSLAIPENPERILIESTIERALETVIGSKLVGFAARTYGPLNETVEIHIYSYPWDVSVRPTSESGYGAASIDGQIWRYDLFINFDDLNSLYLTPTKGDPAVQNNPDELIVHELIHLSGLADSETVDRPLDKPTDPAILAAIQAEVGIAPSVSKSENVNYTNLVKAEMHDCDKAEFPPYGIHPVSPPRGLYDIKYVPKILPGTYDFKLASGYGQDETITVEYDPATVTLLTGDEVGTVEVLYAGNSSPVILSVTPDYQNTIPILNISKMSLVDLRDVLIALSNLSFSDYHVLADFNLLTPADDTLYKDNVVAFGENMQSLFTSYLA